MSAPGKVWRVREGGFANSIGKHALLDGDRFVGILPPADAKAIAEAMNSRAVVEANNAKGEAEPVAWQFCMFNGNWISCSRREYETAIEQGIQARPLFTSPPSQIAKVRELRENVWCVRWGAAIADLAADEIIKLLEGGEG